MTWPPALTVSYTCLPVATGWPAFGESCHGVCEAGLPSPGDQVSWGKKKGRESTEEDSGFRNLLCAQCLTPKYRSQNKQKIAKGTQDVKRWNQHFDHYINCNNIISLGNMNDNNIHKMRHLDIVHIISSNQTDWSRVEIVPYLSVNVSNDWTRLLHEEGRWVCPQVDVSWRWEACVQYQGGYRGFDWWKADSNSASWYFTSGSHRKQVCHINYASGTVMRLFQRSHRGNTLPTVNQLSV